MAEIGVGIIGTGFMGECHALAFSAVTPLFQPGLRPRLEVVADVNAPAAERARDRFGFARATGDWRELVADPRVELVSITAPNILHKEMALAAIAAGKHVYCEKPLALTAADARELTLAAEARACGRWSATTISARRRSGTSRSSWTMASSAGSPICAAPSRRTTWPTRPCRSPGAATAAGRAAGRWATWAATRSASPAIWAGRSPRCWATPRWWCPSARWRRPARDLQFGRVEQPAEMRAVENEDIAHCLFRFASGVLGSMIASRTAWGRKNGPDLELYGTLGGVRFRQERFNEFELFRAGRAQGRQRLSHRLLRPLPRRLRPVHAGPRPRHRLQRPEGDRGRGPAGGHRPGGPARPRLPRGLGDRGRLRRDPGEFRAPGLGPGGHRRLRPMN